jgi:glucose/arabinose dehydrogenase/PKD repeat protein
MSHRSRRLLVTLGLTAASVVAVSPAATASTLPTGFEEVTLVSGLAEPTAVDWAPDGRMFIAERGGRILVLNPDGRLAATPLLDFSSRLGHQGLAGLAVDRDFATNNFLYLGYTTATALGRVTRVVVRPDNALENPAAPETVLLGTATTSPCPAPGNTNDCLDGDAEHAVNSVVSDPRDGTLWISSGDFSVGTGVQSEAFLAYDEQSYAGKILHIDRDGRGLPGHPFCPTDVDLSHVCTKIHAKGFRNPFRFSLRSDGRPLVGDVGFVTREELDLVEPGRNYGWPCYEGTIRTPGYKDEARCPPEYAKEGTAAAAAPPVYDYAHNSSGGAIVGGPTYGSGGFPDEYDGDVFFGDYAQGVIRRLRLDAQDRVTSVTSFATDLGPGVDLKLAPDGDLVYVDYRGAVRRIRYAAGNRDPVARATATPTYGPVPLSVQFDGTGSSDLDGQALTYSWDFGDGTAPRTDTRPVHIYPDGTRDFVARLTVSDGNGGTATDEVTITPGNSPPRADVSAPATYQGGQTVQLSGTVTDEQDGPLSVGSFQWTARIIHIDHVHPAASANGSAEFSFDATTDHDADSHYEVTLTATDSRGLKGSRTVTIRPETRQLTIDTLPTGSTVTYNGADRATPFSRQATVGFHTSISAPQTLERSAQVYEFVGWSDGGARLHDITVPAVDSGLVATYRAAQTTAFEAESMMLPTTANTASVYSTTTASGGRAVRLWQNATVTRSLTLAASSSVMVRALAELCSGAPNMVVRVDGTQALSTPVPATAFTDYAVPLMVAAGTHTVDVAFTNDFYGGAGCDRNLHLDKVSFVSAASAGDITPPAAPTGLTAIAGNGTVALDWADNTDSDLAGYDVFRSATSGGPYTKANANVLAGSAFTDTGLQNGTTYYYVVKALDGSGNASLPSSQVSAAPAGSTAFYIEAESMTLPAAANAVTIYSTTAASGGKAARYWQSVSLTKTVTLPASTGLSVRAMGEQCSGAPNMVVRVDGSAVLTTLVPATTFTYYDVPVNVAAGVHTVEVAFTNDYYGGPGCDRNLHFDKLSFTTSGGSTPPPSSTPVVLEAENMTLPTALNIVIYSTTSASGGKAVRYWQNGTVTKTLTVPATTQLTVRARGDQCNGAPNLVVRVDGAQVFSTVVPATVFSDYSVQLSLAAGAHTVEVAFTNDFYGGTGCDRNLHLDKLTFSP